MYGLDVGATYNLTIMHVCFIHLFIILKNCTCMPFFYFSVKYAQKLSEKDYKITEKFIIKTVYRKWSFKRFSCMSDKFVFKFQD